MSDREFENYLTLLASLLRLDLQQRSAIADELRSHLEDRLEELIARGISRDEAVKQSLAEFGDAAGLAGQFLAINRNRKRRWLMRTTTFSVAATLLIAAAIAIFWPGRNAAPGPAIALAQTAEQTKEASPPVLRIANTEAAQSLDDKLNKRIKVSFEGVPLKDALDSIAEQTDIQFYLARKKLEEASLSEDVPVTLRFKDVRVSTLLDFMLKEFELTYVDRDDVIVVTTPEDAESALVTRVYDCRDLLAMPTPTISNVPSRAGVSNQPVDLAPRISAQASSGNTIPPPPTVTGSAPGTTFIPSGASSPPQPNPPAAVAVHPYHKRPPQTEYERRASDLIGIIIGTSQPDSWDDVGGPGGIDSYNGLIVVSQTAEVHKKVERLLDMLREAAGLEVPKSGKVVR